MFLFWTVSLMFVLQRVSSDEEVSLSCNQMVEVTTGGAVTLQCSVTWKSPIAECGNISFTWNRNRSDLCRSNVCTEENATLIRMKMRSVWEEQTVTVGVLSGCGMNSSTIRVKLVEDEITFNKSSSTMENLTVMKVLPVAAAACAGAGVLLYMRKRRLKNRKQENVDQEEQLTEDQDLPEETTGIQLLQRPEKESSRGQTQVDASPKSEDVQVLQDAGWRSSSDQQGASLWKDRFSDTNGFIQDDFV